LEALGIARGSYLIRVNNRKVLDGLLESVGLGGEGEAGRRLVVLRALDKLDKFGPEGVRLLLGKGREDESGDFTPGAELGPGQSGELERLLGDSRTGRQGLDELRLISRILEACGYGAERIAISPSVVRGLEYYTGPVYEAELLDKVPNEKGEIVQFGSVGGG